MKSREPARQRLYVAEPPSAFRVRRPLTIDCSLLASALFMEPTTEDAQATLRDWELHAPTLIGYELANVALKKSSRGGDALAADALAGFRSLDIELHSVDFAEMLALARRYLLTAYDAAYLWLAAELRTPLATFDRRLGEAATRHLSSLT